MPDPETEPQIFVLIASYRDPECCKTVRDCFEQAEIPERIFVGICWQFNEEDPFDCVFEDEPYRDHVRIDRVPHMETQGVCWARRRAQLLYRGENYILVIDGHMLFEKGWDRFFIDELARCPSPKSILSAYPAAYTLPRNKEFPPPYISYANWHRISDPVGPEYPRGNIRGAPRGLKVTPKESKPTRGVLFSAGFSFMPSLALREVPYDPFCYWDEEEISFGIRLWTHGWTIYAPSAHVIHHLYAPARQGNTHRVSQQIDAAERQARVKRSKLRYFHMLGIIPTSDEGALQELDRYGLGKERTVRSYEAFTGFDLAKQTITIRSYQSWFALMSPGHALNQPQNKKDPLFETMRNVQAKRKGPDSGSTLKNTALLRENFLKFFNQHHIKSVLDIGCGVSDWFLHIPYPLERYVGLDFLSEVCEQRRAESTETQFQSVEFRQGDIRNAILEPFDLVVCRDCFTHFNYEGIVQALACIRQSGSKFACFSHYLKDCKRNDGVNVPPGRWYRLNLMLPPYGFPAPIEQLNDNPNYQKRLAVWNVQSIPDFLPAPTLELLPPQSPISLYQKVFCANESEYLYSLFDATQDYNGCMREGDFALIDNAAFEQSAILRNLRDRICTLAHFSRDRLNMVLLRCTKALRLQDLPQNQAFALLLPPQQKTAQILIPDLFQNPVPASNGALIGVQNQEVTLTIEPAAPVYLCPQTRLCEWGIAFLGEALTLNEAQRWLAPEEIP